MARIKIFFAGLTILVLLSFSYTFACNGQEIKSETSPTVNSEMGKISSKEEVVYGKLNYSGKPQGIYIINILDVVKAGKITDYGQYELVKNLTNLHDIEHSDNKISSYADVGNFFYQGNMKTLELPWEICINYSLDSEGITASELIGQSGNLNIEIVSKKNERVAGAFFENYILQFAITLDTDKCRDIIADGGVMANSGRDKIITFTVMPNTDGYMSINANVTDFAMEGISINAAPFVMNLELPDTSAMEKDLNELFKATGQLSDAASGLESGLDSLTRGVQSLQTGSAEYQTGIVVLNENSPALINASTVILESIDTLSSSSAKLGNNELSFGLKSLAINYAEFHQGLKDYTYGLSQLASKYDKIDFAITSLTEGTKGLAYGAGELSDGLTKLNKESKHMPHKINNMIDDLTGNLDTSDYIPPSFVSSENENVRAVQFVFNTAPIQKESRPDNIEAIPKETFWGRLKGLFFPRTKIYR
ncbi:MAG TPA: hypothetical protein VFD02_03250 [Syntrophomonadaceae bacterium]|nr:hypothetical protein [Syntrophomonadaceae bacterium]